jgi:hypothetical protein
MARFTPYSRAVVAQMWPRGREGKAAIQCLWRGRGRVSCYASVVLLSIAFTTFKIKQLEVIVLSLVVPLVATNLIQFQSDMVLATDTGEPAPSLPAGGAFGSPRIRGRQDRAAEQEIQERARFGRSRARRPLVLN